MDVLKINDDDDEYLIELYKDIWSTEADFGVPR